MYMIIILINILLVSGSQTFPQYAACGGDHQLNGAFSKNIRYLDLVRKKIRWVEEGRRASKERKYSSGSIGESKGLVDLHI